jgi:hypothetical protein
LVVPVHGPGWVPVSGYDEGVSDPGAVGVGDPLCPGSEFDVSALGISSATALEGMARMAHVMRQVRPLHPSG